MPKYIPSLISTRRLPRSHVRLAANPAELRPRHGAPLNSSGTEHPRLLVGTDPPGGAVTPHRCQTRVRRGRARRGHRPTGAEGCEKGGPGCAGNGDAVGWDLSGNGMLAWGAALGWAVLNSVGSGWESSLLPRTLRAAHPRLWVRQGLTHRRFIGLCGPSGPWKLELHHSCWF